MLGCRVINYKRNGIERMRGLRLRSLSLFCFFIHFIGIAVVRSHKKNRTGLIYGFLYPCKAKVNRFNRDFCGGENARMTNHIAIGIKPYLPE